MFDPLGWIFLVLLAANLVLFILLVLLREHWLLYERRRAPIRARLEPVVERLVEGRDPENTAAELERIVAALDRTSRPVAAWLLRDLSRGADEEMRQRVREVLDGAGAIDAAEEGTRRWMPWRRALACEILGQIGAERSVPVLITRLGDGRAEVRMAAARALGAIGSPQAEPALASAFLERTKVPTGVAYDALCGLGPSGAEAFSRGLHSSDPTVRVASCFGSQRRATRARRADYRGTRAFARARRGTGPVDVAGRPSCSLSSARAPFPGWQQLHART